MLAWMKKLNRSRAGLTLIELLAAVAILAVASVPLLHAFVTSSRTLTRSRTGSEAMLAARIVQEAVEQCSISSITAGSSKVQALLGAAGIDLLDDGSCLASGIKQGSGSYDAVVSFDAAASLNDVSLVSAAGMDTVFAQPCTAEENPDLLAAEAFRSACPASGGASYTRTIRICLEQNAADSSRVSVSVSYEYCFSAGSAPFYYTADYSAASFDASSGSGTAPSVYIMYFPCYDAEEDCLAVENTGDIPVSLFLVKQRALQLQPDGSYTPMDEAALTAAEAGCVTEIDRYHSASYAGGCRLYTNAGLNPVTGEPGAAVRCRLYKGPVWYEDESDALTGELTELSAQDRWYDVTIRIYASGSDLTGDSLYTLHTTKLS